MGKLITLKNGEQKPILSINDLFDIITEFVGNEVTDCLKEEFNECQYVAITNEQKCDEYEVMLTKAIVDIDKAIDDLGKLTIGINQIKDLLEEDC